MSTGVLEQSESNDGMKPRAVETPAAADMGQRDYCCLTVSNDLYYVPIVLDYVRGVATQCGFGDADRQRIELAVEEAVTNVIEHAFAPDEVATFDVICRRVAHGLEIRIRDKGMPFDPSQMPEYRPDAALDQQTGQGLGGFLIKQFVDEYEICNLGPEGKETRLVKFLDTLNIAEGRPEKSLPHVLEPPDAPTDQPIDVNVRWMRKDEAIEVARCVYDSYGYSYGYEHIYYPDRVAALNQSGELRSAVAVTESGEIAGHFAMVFADNMPAEIAIAVTKQQYRGRGVAGHLAKFLGERARAMRLKGLYGKQVTVHPYTQQFNHKLGYHDCAFLLAHTPANTVLKGIAPDNSNRGSDVLGFKYFWPAAPRIVYPPDRHAEMVVKLYENLRVPITAAKSSELEFPTCQTIMRVSVNARKALGDIRIPQYGSDVVDMLHRELWRLSREEVRVVEMYLNLADSVTPLVVAAAEKLGFIFTGILPETGRSDSLIMQWFNGVNVDYDSLQVVSDIAKELLAYIRANDPVAV